MTSSEIQVTSEDGNLLTTFINVNIGSWFVYKNELYMKTRNVQDSDFKNSQKVPPPVSWTHNPSFNNDTLVQVVDVEIKYRSKK